MEHDTDFARRRFPAVAEEITALAARNESFRDLCHDFATADELVRMWKTSTDPERDERYAEALELVDGLGKEIGTMLDLAKVVPFPMSR
jgi:hypothetical protein